MGGWWYVADEVATLVRGATLQGLANLIKNGVFDPHPDFVGLAFFGLAALVWRFELFGLSSLGGVVVIGMENFRKRSSIVI